MTITLYRNESEHEKVDKTLVIIRNVTGTLRAETSLINPVIQFTGTLASFSNVNHVYIPDFGRYYYVTGMRSIRDGLVEMSMHVDVLMTYKSQIRANTAIVKQQEQRWNLYLNDGSLRVYQNPRVYTKPFQGGFGASWDFVLAVAGR